MSERIIKNIQKKLLVLQLYSGEINGNFDELTKGALNEFQRINKLSVGGLTLESLKLLKKE